MATHSGYTVKGLWRGRKNKNDQRKIQFMTLVQHFVVQEFTIIQFLWTCGEDLMLDVIMAGMYMKDKVHVVGQEVREQLGVRFNAL